LFDTLIADANRVYNPAIYDDRLLLGLKGAMSEAELHILKARMLEGHRATTRRGELGKAEPMWYLRRPSGEVVFDPDEQHSQRSDWCLNVYGVRPTDRRRQKAGRPSTGRRLLRAEEAADFRRARPIEKDGPPTTLAPQALLERLAAEYVFAQLCQAGMHAFEAENEARMLAMTSAKTNIETKLAGLSQREDSFVRRRSRRRL
jgi:hypothetical protein